MTETMSQLQLHCEGFDDGDDIDRDDVLVVASLRGLTMMAMLTVFTGQSVRVCRGLDDWIIDDRAPNVDIGLTLSVDDELFRVREMFVDDIDDDPIVERAIVFNPD